MLACVSRLEHYWYKREAENADFIQFMFISSLFVFIIYAFVRVRIR